MMIRDHCFKSQGGHQPGKVREFESGQGKCVPAFGVPAITLFNEKVTFTVIILLQLQPKLLPR